MTVSSAASGYFFAASGAPLGDEFEHFWSVMPCTIFIV
jgi:hypothetical protein